MDGVSPFWQAIITLVLAADKDPPELYVTCCRDAINRVSTILPFPSTIANVTTSAYATSCG